MQNSSSASPVSNIPGPSHSAPTPSPLDHLEEMERVRAIGELSEYKIALDEFRRRELEQYSPAATPPGREELAKRWEKEGVPRPAHPEAGELAGNSLQEELHGTDIAMRQNHELTAIEMARSSWDARLQESRRRGDDSSIREWEQMGKGVFYPDSEEERQRLVSRRHECLNSFNRMLDSDPGQALALLEGEDAGSLLPPTVRVCLESQARKSVSSRQRDFYRNLLDNELNGTPLQQDSVREALKKSYLPPEQARLHLKRLEEGRPLKSEETIRLPLLNTAFELIDSYVPENDPREERKRSILGLIAACDEDREGKTALLRRLEQQEKDPGLARARKECSQYLKKLYEETGFGSFGSYRQSSPDEEAPSLSRESWLSAQRKLNSARKAMDDLLSSGRLSPEDREKELPRRIFRAVREERHVDFSSLVNGYPVFLKASPEAPESSTRNSESSAVLTGSSAWNERLNAYFSSGSRTSLKKTDREVAELFHDWLQNEKK